MANIILCTHLNEGMKIPDQINDKPYKPLYDTMLQNA